MKSPIYYVFVPHGQRTKLFVIWSNYHPNQLNFGALTWNMPIFDHLSMISTIFSIRSNFHFNQILFLHSQRWFLPNSAKIGLETKKLWRFYCALTWYLPIFDHLSKISTIFPFHQISILVKSCSSMVKDDSYQIWRRLVMKQKSYCDFTVL